MGETETQHVRVFWICGTRRKPYLWILKIKLFKKSKNELIFSLPELGTWNLAGTWSQEKLGDSFCIVGFSIFMGHNYLAWPIKA